MSHEEERKAELAQGNLLSENPGAQPLRAKWEAFALGKVEGLSNTEAAIRAGFSKPTAAQKGSYLNRQVQVRLRIESLRKLITEKTVEKRAEAGVAALATLDDHLGQLAKIRDAALKAEAFTAAAAAEMGRGKALGYHTERVRPEDLEAMGEEELKAVVAGKSPRLRLA